MGGAGPLVISDGGLYTPSGVSRRSLSEGADIAHGALNALFFPIAAHPRHDMNGTNDVQWALNTPELVLPLTMRETMSVTIAIYGLRNTINRCECGKP